MKEHHLATRQSHVLFMLKGGWGGSERNQDLPPELTAQLDYLYTLNVFSRNARALSKYRLPKFFIANNCSLLLFIYI